MKEINDIIRAYKTASSKGLLSALATVVSVEGSSYRRPGARMLITEEGNLTGAISGGCLEGDALRKALLAIHQKKNKLITYDTSNPDDLEFGVQLGCNGIVHILFEFIDPKNPANPIALLEEAIRERKEAIVITFFSIKNRAFQMGTVAVFKNQFMRTANNKIQIDGLKTEVKLASQNKQTVVTKINNEQSSQDALLQYIAPQITLVIAGAGNDAKPLVEAANLLGWKTIVADGRATHAVSRRFPKAHQVLLATPEELVNQVEMDELTLFVLMTHNYNYDLALLKLLLNKPIPYIGVLGPKTKLNKMLNDLNSAGMAISERELNKIYGPVGLDIGAETSEEIAISVVAEIKAVLSGRKGYSLKFKEKKIHTDTNQYLIS